MARKNKGRKKLEMVKIPNDSNLQVTFSKRRSGLFKKASELCTLCGAEVAVIVFSPSKKVFSFGNPSVESVVDRFVNRNPLQTSYTIQLFEAHRNANFCELNMQLTEVLNQLEAEKKRGEELTKIRKASQCQCWWEAPIEELSPSQLEQLKVSLEDLKKNVTQQVEEVMFQSSAALQYHPGSSSTGGVVPFDPNNTGFNHSNMNMMPHPLPPPHQPHQPLPFPSSPHHPHPHPSHGFNPGFGSGLC